MYLRNKLAIRGLYNLLSRNSDADVSERSFFDSELREKHQDRAHKRKRKIGKIMARDTNK